MTLEEAKQALKRCKESAWGRCEGCTFYTQTCGKIEELVSDCEQRIPRWISVEEKMPTDNTTVLVLMGDIVTTASRRNETWLVHSNWYAGEITYWMPIPPKEAE